MADLKPALEADLPDIVALTNKAYRETGPGASWNVESMIEGPRTTEADLRADLAASPDAQLLIWRNAQGEHLGHVWLEPGEAGGWYLGMLTVRPDRQDQKLGRELLAAAETFACDRGARRMELTVVNARDTLMAWYERRGYRRTGLTPPFPYEDTRLGRPTQPDLCFVVMARDL